MSDEGAVKAYANRIRLVYIWLVFFMLCWISVRVSDINSLDWVLGDHWQFLDSQELMLHPIDSLLTLHSQPPLLNFIVWVLMHLPGSLYEDFIILNAACIATVACCIFKVSGRYTQSIYLPWGISIAYVLSPAVLLNVAYPFYPCLTAAGYAILVYSFYSIEQDDRKALAFFVFSVCYLILLRSSFSLSHLGVYWAIFILLGYKKYKRPALMAALSITMVVALVGPVKNYMMYGFFGSSSWAPLNLAKGFGVATPLGYFPKPTVLAADSASECRKSYGFQDRALKKHNGYDNYNSCHYVDYGRAVGRALWSGYSVKQHLGHILTYTSRYLSVPDKYFELKNRADIAEYADAFNAATLTIDAEKLKLHDLRLGFLMAVTAGFVVCYLRRDKLLAVMLFVLVVHFLSHVLTDGSEGQRFVFDIDFIFYIFIVAGCVSLIRLIRERLVLGRSILKAG